MLVRNRSTDETGKNMPRAEHKKIMKHGFDDCFITSLQPSETEESMLILGIKLNIACVVRQRILEAIESSLPGCDAQNGYLEKFVVVSGKIIIEVKFIAVNSRPFMQCWK